jgi:selenide,water dikinase
VACLCDYAVSFAFKITIYEQVLMKFSDTPIVKDLVLVGGGHSHLAVLKYFGMNPVPGLRLTLITRDLHTPYSGMLPGYIAGHYDYDDVHIDLRPLAQFAHARIYHEEVQGLDVKNNLVLCPNRPPVPFDVLSINIGSRPNTLHIPGADLFATPIKPIDHFLHRWEDLIHNVLTAKDIFRLAVVGGGAGGVEMSLATQYRLQKELRQVRRPTDLLEIVLITDTKTILPTHNRLVRHKFERVLRERNITFQVNHRVVEVNKDKLVFTSGQKLAADAVLWVTHASAPAWLAEAGLKVDEQGFIVVNECLQSVSHKNIFAAGDIAAVQNHPRPKSGVFAVRQGPPLARNLALVIRAKNLKRYKPQKQFLGLISTGDRNAIASRANWSIDGQWVWRIKDWIDRRFMDNFSKLPEMNTEQAPDVDTALAGIAATKEISAMNMRCGGCGAKIGSTILSRVIQRLDPISREDVLVGLKEPDDAAITQVPTGKLVVQSVDYFRSFIDDPHLFGKIAANHALSDIFAMGAEAQTALAIATVPYGVEEQVEELLFQTMSGAVDVLNASNTALVGGHTCEGAELSFGLAVTGLVEHSRVLRKSGMRKGNILILTKPLGTGTLFAADMRLKAKGRWIDSALKHMLLSNQQAGLCLHRYGATACTDITGFGLLGHLVEMTSASHVVATITLDNLPIMDGALECIAMDIFSSLQEQNIRLGCAIINADELIRHKHYPLLFDPQTSGGLLASIPSENTDECVQELIRLGYPDTAIIGEVSAVSDPDRIGSITLIAK